MDEVRRYVNLAFVFAGMLMSWLCVNVAKWVMGFFRIADVRLMGELVTYSTVIGILLAVIAIVILWRNAKVYENALNVAHEMRKVTWPTFDETKYAMKIVIVTCIIVALILSGFDLVAKELTGLILGIN
ncbi:MAG: preprotein translocase subunit SecE [Proteobacteria bacterium]|nr:preprotein translocase subunit SecE [Pseudomonadota bacterium]